MALKPPLLIFKNKDMKYLLYVLGYLLCTPLAILFVIGWSSYFTWLLVGNGFVDIRSIAYPSCGALGLAMCGSVIISTVYIQGKEEEE